MTPEQKARATRLTGLAIVQGITIAFAWVVSGVPRTPVDIVTAIMAHLFFVLSVIDIWRVIDDER